MLFRLGPLKVSVERTRSAPERRYVFDLLPLHVIPYPAGTRLSKVLGELLFQLTVGPNPAYQTRLLTEFGQAAWPEYLEVDVWRARLLADWLVQSMAPAWLRWDNREDLAARLEALRPLTEDLGPTVAVLTGISEAAAYDVSSDKLFMPAKLHSMPVWNAVTLMLHPNTEAPRRALKLAHQAGIYGANQKISGYKWPQSDAEVERLTKPILDQLDESLAEVMREAEHD